MSSLGAQGGKNFYPGFLVSVPVAKLTCYCLDFNKINEDGEPPVVVFVPGVDTEHQTYEIIAEDFGNYLLQVVEQELV